MQRHQLEIALLGIMMLLCSCEGTTFKSSVPTYPVRVSINTKLGAFVNFVPENTYQYITIDRNGYHYNDYHQALLATDMIGYGGILIYIDGGGQYDAFDMCCPHCLKPQEPVEVNGFFAVCPTCGEEYDLSFGYAVPTKGISTEALRRYTVMNSDGKLTIQQ